MPMNPFVALESAIASDPRDWSANERDAWLYGIMVGWGDGALKEIAEDFGWSDEKFGVLYKTNLDFKQAQQYLMHNHQLTHVWDNQCREYLLSLEVKSSYRPRVSDQDISYY